MIVKFCFNRSSSAGRKNVAVVQLLVFMTSMAPVFAIYNMMTPELDADDAVHDPKLLRISNDISDYLRFIGYEHHLAFVGARNNLFVINMTSSVEQRQLVIRMLDFPAMNDSNQACLDLFVDDEKESELVCRSTYVRALLRRPTDDSVVFCGIGAFEPRCWLCKDAAKKLLHKAGDLYDFKPHGYHLELINSGKDIVPFEPDSNFTHFISGGHIFSGIYESPEVNSAIFQPVIVSRPLADLDVNASQDTITRSVIAESSLLSRPHFIGSFDAGDFGYMFFNEQRSAKVAQFCKHGGPTALSTSGQVVSASFFKAFLFCGFIPQKHGAPLNVENIFSSSSAPSRFEQLADVTPLSQSGNNRFFYGAFNRNPDVHSAIGICLFEESNVRQVFAKSPFVRLSSAGGTLKPNLPVAYGTEDLPSRPNNCSAKFADADRQAMHNFRVKYNHMYRLVTAVNSEPIFYDTTVSYRLTSIAVDWNPTMDKPGWQHLLFVGTNNGRLLRIAVELVEQDFSSSALLRNAAKIQPTIPPGFQSGPFDSPMTFSSGDPFLPKLTSRLLSRVKIFTESSPIMRLSSWPPGYTVKTSSQKTSISAILVVSKTAVALHFVRSANACQLPAKDGVFCSCLKEGYPFCLENADASCSSNQKLSSHRNDTLKCDGARLTPIAEAVTDAVSGGTPVHSSSTNPSVLPIIIGVVIGLSCVGILIVAFVCYKRAKIGQKRTAYTDGAADHADGLPSSMLVPSVVVIEPRVPVKVSVQDSTTEMTPKLPVRSKRTVPIQPALSTKFGTLSRYGSKHSSRHHLLYNSIPQWKSLPDQLNDDLVDDSKCTTDDDEQQDDLSASPAAGTQTSRLSPSSPNQSDDSPARTPGAVSLPAQPPTPSSGLMFSQPLPAGQPHNRIQTSTQHSNK